MSTSAKSNPQPDAGDVLADLLSKEEYIAVLKYCVANNLDSDSEVLFIVATLKIFSHLFNSMLHTVELANQGRKNIEASTLLAEQRMRDTLTKGLASLRLEISRAEETMARHADRFAKVGAEMSSLYTNLLGAKNDAENAFAAYNKLKGDVDGTTLSQMVYEQANAALDKRLTTFDKTFSVHINDMIESASRETTFLVAASLFCQVIVGLILIFKN